MKIISFATLKGGTGKTMSLFSIAGALAKKKRVLLIDCDPQCNLTSNVGLDITETSAGSLWSIFEDRAATPEKVISKAPIEQLPKLDIIPSSMYLFETEMNLVSRSGREQILKNWLDKNKSSFEAYDYILCDTNPSMGIINQNAFVVSDSIILVTDVGMNAVIGAEMFIYLWGSRREDLGLEDNVTAIIINNLDKRLSVSSDLPEFIRDHDDLKSLLVMPAIPARAAIKDTEFYSLPITLHAPKSDGAETIELLIKALTKKGAL